MFSLNALENTISLFPIIEAGEQKMLSGKRRKGASATQELGHFLLETSNPSCRTCDK